MCIHTRVGVGSGMSEQDLELVCKLHTEIVALERRLGELHLQRAELAGRMYAKYGRGHTYEVEGDVLIVSPTKALGDGSVGYFFASKYRGMGGRTRPIRVRTRKPWSEREPDVVLEPPVRGNVVEVEAHLTGRSEAGPVPYCARCGTRQHSTLQGLLCEQGHLASEPMYEGAPPESEIWAVAAPFCSKCKTLQTLTQEGVLVCEQGHVGITSLIGRDPANPRGLSDEDLGSQAGARGLTNPYLSGPGVEPAKVILDPVIWREKLDALMTSVEPVLQSEGTHARIEPMRMYKPGTGIHEHMAEVALADIQAVADLEAIEAIQATVGQDPTVTYQDDGKAHLKVAKEQKLLSISEPRGDL
jgi:hypothetical protein